MAEEIHGLCAPGFEAVRNAFATNFEEGHENGAAVTVTIDQEPVVELWAGRRDVAGTLPWERDTLANVWSTTKGLTAICAHVLVDRGQLDLDAPVAKYWPEFAQAGKAEIPVRWLLSHRAGVPALRETLPPHAAWDWDTMVEALAAEEPWWVPGESFGYHAVTFGWLVGEVIRRVSGKSLGTFFREEVAEPFDIDFHIGLDAGDDSRVAEVAAAPPPPPGETTPMTAAMEDPASMASLAFNNPVEILNPEIVNSRDWRAAELGAVNGHTTATGLARAYGLLACGGELNGVRLLRQETIDQMYVEQSMGENAVTMGPMRIGLGFMLPMEDNNYGRGPRAFGHPGAGGSLGYADPDARVGFGYVMNQMGAQPDTRSASLVEALNASL